MADQTQLWAERYERELAGILALQNDVARQVAKALALKLLPAEQARLAGAKTVDPEVYDLILKAKAARNATRAGLDTAEQYFLRALAKDPASALAYAGIGSVWLNRQQFGWSPVREAGPKAKAAALKAVELDDTLARAHMDLGSVRWLVDFDLPGAEREFRRAMELDPSDVGPNYAHILMILRRPDEAMREIERVVAIDPLNLGPRGFYANLLAYAGRYDEALAQANQVLRARPGNLVALSAVMTAQHMKQQYAEVIAAQAAYYEGLGRPDVAEALKKGYAESGYAGAWRKANDVELAKHGGEPGVAFDVGGNYALAGDRARALDWLEKAYAERDPNMLFIGFNPIFDSLRAEPRFQALLKAMGLPQWRS